ncbi:carbohydrate kinase family protein [Jiella sonneratiae]|uniref:Carbohydrate kinase family protein n=1 Tax=Jiella sonneratiae TaxID=2816856 RepID=A0ABS3J7J8_9HYPH|nr:carbohydrate kinase family protein [Jiella sonneratiae]MBO0905645.1 carbohydrate kinase family protein [Jiella sonneratiae]
MKVPGSSGDRPAILVVGAAHIDRRAKAFGPFFPGASNPGLLQDAAGGSAFNAAVALKASGFPVRFLGVRGGDEDGRRVAKAIEAAGLDDLGVTFLDRRTPTYTAILDDRGELVAGIADMELYALLGPKLLRRRHVRPRIAEAAAVLVDANLSEAMLAATVEAAGPRPVAALGVSPVKVLRLLPVLARLDALFLSRAEAASLAEVTTATNLHLIAHLVAELGARRAVITDGAHDAAILDEGRLSFQRPPAVRPLDVTGAGDTLAAVAVAARLSGSDFLDAARRGIVAASLRISSPRFPPADLAAEIDRQLPSLAEPVDETRHRP